MTDGSEYSVVFLGPQLMNERPAPLPSGTDARDVFELTKAFAQRTNPGAPNSENTRRRIAYWEGILSK